MINTNRAQGTIGGNVNIESLQDTATYDSKQKSAGFSADINLVDGAGSSLSVNGGKTNVNADYKGVGEQSGIFTGDSGFDRVVEGKTTLIGGAKGIGNIPSDTANAYANVIGKEVPHSFPYSSEGAELVGEVAQNVAGVVITIGGIKVNAKRGQNNTSNTNGATNRADIWNMSNQFERGRKIEDDLAVTEYSSWQKIDNFIDPKKTSLLKQITFH